MRRYLPALLVTLASLTPVLGCDLFKEKGVDAGDDGAVVESTPAATTAAVADPAATPTDTPPAAPLGATTTAPVAPNGQPAVKPADGGAAPKTDGGTTDGGAAPTPPPLFPAFDASAFKGFDSGGLFQGFDGGFKPPF
ncbi:MAG: hypothetical protein KIT84_06140 [Labilithrix sp.]|nr:hypothetical protein [Labilithrix sp.]MCW5810571.1 hypothetical protein [Labilithrix sp.]